MKKLKVITGLLLILATAILAVSTLKDVNANSNPLPAFNIRVMQYGGTTPQSGAQVIYYLGSTYVTEGDLTNGDGWCYKTLETGTYNVYVYYPQQPNDGRSGSLSKLLS
jgi:hypothetical protein